MTRRVNRVTTAPSGARGIRKAGSNVNYRITRNHHGKKVVTKTTHAWSRYRRGKRYHTRNTDRYVVGDEAVKRRARPSKEQRIEETNSDAESNINQMESNGAIDEASNDLAMQDPTNADNNQDENITPINEINHDEQMQGSETDATESDESQDTIPVDNSNNDQPMLAEQTEAIDSNTNQDAILADIASHDKPMPEQEEQPEQRDADATQEVNSERDEEASSDQPAPYMEQQAEQRDEEASSDEPAPDMEQQVEQRNNQVMRDMYNLPADDTSDDR